MIREGAPDKPGIYVGAQALANAQSDNIYREPVTEYVTGWMERQSIEADLNAIAPRVDCNQQFSFAKRDNDDSFLSESDDIRAPYNEFKRIDFKGEMVDSSTQDKGLTLRLDKRNLPAGGNAVERAAQNLMMRVMRNELRRAWGIIDGLDGSATSKTWDGTAGQDPDMDVLNSLEAAADSSGVYPNTVIYGATAWTKRLLTLRKQTHAGGFATSGLTKEQLADFLGVDQVIILRERYVTKRAGTKTKVATGQVVSCYLSPFPTFDDASNCKRFVSPSEDGGGDYAIYVDDTHSRFIDITATTNSRILAPTTLGADELAIS